MRPKERRDGGQKDLFRARLDQIVDMSHPLPKLAAMIDWDFLEQRFGAVYADVPGRPPLCKCRLKIPQKLEWAPRAGQRLA